jgi:hypothetical protein
MTSTLSLRPARVLRGRRSSVLVRRMKRFIAVFMLSGWSFGYADTCDDTSTTAIVSRDGNIAVRIDSGSPVEPGKIRTECVATLTKWNGKEQSYRFLRRMTLRNEVRPKTAAITEDARFLVTFDDYCEMGTTANTIVIYDLQEGSSYAHALNDFVPAWYRQTLEESISSIHWREDPRVGQRDNIHKVYVSLRGGRDRYGYIVIDAAKNSITFGEGAKLEK